MLVLRCNGVAGCGIVIGVGGVQTQWGFRLWCCDWCWRCSDVMGLLVVIGVGGVQM